MLYRYFDDRQYGQDKWRRYPKMGIHESNNRPQGRGVGFYFFSKNYVHRFNSKLNSVVTKLKRKNKTNTRTYVSR